jgi:phosphatidylserine decarboxylase
MTIHKEGYSIILIALVILCAINYAAVEFIRGYAIITSTLQVLSLIMFLLVLNFFRSPTKNIVPNDNTVLAPADGKVVVIEETTETEVLKDRRIQVSIFMSPLNVHVNRYPVSGKISFLRYHPGLFLVAWHPKSSTENERTTVVIDNAKGVRFLVRQIAGAVARRIIYYPKEGQIVEQGHELGFIRFGSRVDVFLPLDAKIKVQMNQKAVGGKTILAELS